MALEEFAQLIPEKLKSQSGSVFFSGRAAFAAAPKAIYLLGLNPGGNLEDYPDYPTVQAHTDNVLRAPDDWSEYCDVQWRAAPGPNPHQRRVLHLLKSLRGNPILTQRQFDFSPGKIPASNLIFVRSQGQNDIITDFDELADMCWPFHQAVIRRLDVAVVVCFGKLCGGWVLQQLGPPTFSQSDYFDETYEYRRRRSVAYWNGSRPAVVVVTHPSRHDWTNPCADPSGLVACALNKALD